MSLVLHIQGGLGYGVDGAIESNVIVLNIMNNIFSYISSFVAFICIRPTKEGS